MRDPDDLRHQTRFYINVKLPIKNGWRGLRDMFGKISIHPKIKIKRDDPREKDGGDD